MPLDIAFIALGSALLYFGAEWLIKGAAGLAARFGVSPLVIGLTVVSFGTSAPELAVSLVAAVKGQSGIALGNVVGSNITNIGVVLGLTALIAPPRVPPLLWRTELPWLVGATAALPLSLRDGRIERSEGAAFLLGGLLFMGLAVRQQRRDPAAESIPEAEPSAPSSGGSLRLGVFALGGLLALGIGGRAFVEGAVSIATDLGVDERVIGLTLVAVGTSLPELAASLVAALRGHSDLAVGNVVGSNLLNVLLIVGAASLAHPISGDLAVLALDLGTLCLCTLLLVVSLTWPRRLSRLEGGLYLALYFGFLATLFAWDPSANVHVAS